MQYVLHSYIELTQKIEAKVWRIAKKTVPLQIYPQKVLD